MEGVYVVVLLGQSNKKCFCGDVRVVVAFLFFRLCTACVMDDSLVSWIALHRYSYDPMNIFLTYKPTTLLPSGHLTPFHPVLPCIFLLFFHTSLASFFFFLKHTAARSFFFFH